MTNNLSYAGVKLALMGEAKMKGSDLLDSADHPWLKAFDTSFDEHVASYLKEFVAKHDNPYDPYPVESLLSELASLLDRCQLYRREIYELEAAAIRQALDYQLFIKQQPILRQLDEAAYFERQRAEEKSANEAAAVAFRESGNPLGAGFEIIASGSARAANEALVGDKERKQLLTAKYALLQQYQEALASRHYEDETALNFKERVDRVLRFVESDIRLAYLKAEAAAYGLDRAFGIASPVLPKADEPKLLDELIRWARAVAEELSVRRQAEFEFERVLSIRQLVGDAEYDKILRAATMEPPPATDQVKILSFDYTKVGQPYVIVPDWNFRLDIESRHIFNGESGQERIRLKGVTASFHARSYEKPETRWWRMTLALFPPWKPLNDGPFSGVQQPPPAILSTVGLLDPRAPSPWVSYYAHQNLDPRGMWTVCVSSKVGVPHNSVPKSLDPTEIYDINLHLLIATTRQDDPYSWRYNRW